MAATNGDINDTTDGLNHSKPKGPAVLFKPHGSRPRKGSKKKKSGSDNKEFARLRKQSWQEVMQEMSRPPVRQKKRSLFEIQKGRELQKSFSMGTIETNPQPVRPRVERRIRDEVEQPSTPPKTFVYKPQPRKKTSWAGLTPTHSPRMQRKGFENGGDEHPDFSSDRPPPLPPHLPPIKPKRHSKKTLERLQTQTFTEMDISGPKVGRADSIASIDDGMGILRMRLLAVSVPHIMKFTKSHGGDESDGEDSSPGPVEQAPTDGLFCIFSISNKQARAETTLQPLQPKKLAAIWDNSESSIFFYASASHQLFITSRKMPLADANSKSEDDDLPLSRRPSAESMGVGIFPVNNLLMECANCDGNEIENWVETDVKRREIRIALEPTGSVLLEMSFYSESLNIHTHTIAMYVCT